MSMLGFWRGQMRQNIMFALFTHDKEDKHGIVIFGVGHLVKPGLLVELDVTFTSRERVPVLPELYMPAAPELAVDVVRLCTVVHHLPMKAKLLLQGGTRRYWVVHTDSEMVEEYTSTGTRMFTKDDTLTCPDILPGFMLSVRDVFDTNY